MFGAIKSLFGFVLIAGVIVALLHVFHGDPFAIISWLWHLIERAINSIAHFFEGNKTFRHVTQNAGSGPNGSHHSPNK